MEYFYIYNLRQSEFFIRNGINIVKIGIGGKGDFYHKFIKDENSKIIFDKWAKNKK